MIVAYWIVAGLLAVFYLYSGGKKVAQSREQLAPMMGWVDTVPMPAVRSQQPPTGTSSLHSPSACCAARSDMLKSTDSSLASCDTAIHDGTTNTSRGPHS